MNPVAVTSLMITGKTVDRLPLAMRAVEAWQAQRYPEKLKKLLIVNHHPSARLLSTDLAGVREIKAAPDTVLGDLRNISIDESDTPYMIQWDDDDYCSPDRLSWQVENTPAGKASLLQYEVHCDLITEEAFVNNGQSIACGISTGGFPGTMLWPREARCCFMSLPKREDTEFVRLLARTCGLVSLPNDPTLYMRCYTGHNTCNRRHVMHRKPGCRELTAIENQQVVRMLLDVQRFVKSA